MLNTVSLRSYLKFIAISIIILLQGCSSLPIAKVDTTRWKTQEYPAQVYLVPTAVDALGYRLQAINSAQDYIEMEYFTWDHDVSGAMVYKALQDASERGVKVRIILDDLLEFNDKWVAELAQNPNFEMKIFNPFDFRKGGWFVRSFDFASNSTALNHRLHQKYFNVDGQLMILGGRNIGDSYFGLSEKANFFDLDMLVKGASIKPFEENFNELWKQPICVNVNELVGRHLAEKKRFTKQYETLKKDNAKTWVAVDDILENLPDPQFIQADVTPMLDAIEKVKDSQPYFRKRVESYLQAFDAGTEDFFLSTPYILPESDDFRMLERFKTMGTPVTLLTNSYSSNDSQFSGAYYRTFRAQLLALQVNLYEYSSSAVNKGFVYNTGSYYHNKAFIVDHHISYIGSSNFDPRSDNLNLELGIMINSPEFAQQLRDYLLNEQLDNFWHVSKTNNGDTSWAKGNTVTTKNPENNNWTYLLDSLIRLFGIHYEL